MFKDIDTFLSFALLFWITYEIVKDIILNRLKLQFLLRNAELSSDSDDSDSDNDSLISLDTARREINNHGENNSLNFANEFNYESQFENNERRFQYLGQRNSDRNYRTFDIEIGRI